MLQRITVPVVATSPVAIGVDAAIDHVIPALKPDHSSQLVSLIRFVVRIHLLDICQDLLYVIDHQAVVVTSCLHPVRFDRNNIFVLLPKSFKLCAIEFIWPSAWRPEVSMQALAAPGSFDDQNRLVQRLLHVDPEGEFRANFVFIRTKTGGQFSLFLTTGWKDKKSRRSCRLAPRRRCFASREAAAQF